MVSRIASKIVQGTGITIISSGADSGTGDVTISATSANSLTESMIIAYAIVL